MSSRPSHLIWFIPSLISIITFLMILTFFTSPSGDLPPLAPNSSIQAHNISIPLTAIGGAPITLSGTLQQLLSQLQSLNPAAQAGFPPHLSGLDLNLPRQTHAGPRHLHRRSAATGPPRPLRHTCRKDFYDVPLSVHHEPKAARSVLEHLGSVRGEPTLEPRRCGRVSCEQGVGIWWCNHNDVELKIDSFGVLRNATQELIDVCHKQDHKSGVGQMEFEGGYSVIFRGGNEC